MKRRFAKPDARGRKSALESASVRLLVAALMLFGRTLFAEEPCNVVLPDGSELAEPYSGECKDGIAHGIGTYAYRFKQKGLLGSKTILMKVSGTFADGVPVGKAVTVDSQGTRYEGQLLNYRAHGQGRIDFGKDAPGVMRFLKGEFRNGEFWEGYGQAVAFGSPVDWVYKDGKGSTCGKNDRDPLCTQLLPSTATTGNVAGVQFVQGNPQGSPPETPMASPLGGSSQPGADDVVAMCLELLDPDKSERSAIEVRRRGIDCKVVLNERLDASSRQGTPSGSVPQLQTGPESGRETSGASSENLEGRSVGANRAADDHGAGGDCAGIEVERVETAMFQNIIPAVRVIVRNSSGARKSIKLDIKYYAETKNYFEQSSREFWETTQPLRTHEAGSFQFWVKQQQSFEKNLRVLKHSVVECGA